MGCQILSTLILKSMRLVAALLVMMIKPINVVAVITVGRKNE